MKINIEGTPLEIIAKANNLKQVNDSNIFVNDKKERFILNPLGFMPVEIYNAQVLKEEFDLSVKEYSSKIIKLETHIDDLEHRLIESNKSAKTKAEIKHLENALLQSAQKNKRLHEELGFEKRIVNYVYHSKSIDIKQFLDFHTQVRDEWKEYKENLKKELNESINNTL